MAKNALAAGPPPIPFPERAQTAPPTAMPMPATPMPGQNALTAGPMDPDAPQLANIPAPTHEQTAAALRHFRIVRGALRKLLENPDLGKVDLRSEAIDVVSGLVGERVIDASVGVQMLSNFPDKPFDQRRAVEKMYADQIHAEVLILDHHKATNPPVYNQFAMESLRNRRAKREHIHIMKGVMAHYAR